MDFFNNYFNTNKIFIGMSLIMINIGSRYITQDFTEIQTKLMSSKVFKQLVLVCIFFTATRDILLSIILSFLFSAIVFGLLDEKKQFNLLHSSILNNNLIRTDAYKNVFKNHLSPGST